MNMKIMGIPAYGPMFRFTDANVYYALYLISDGKRIGRKRLAEEAGVGEGSMRCILEKFREWNFVDIKRTGIAITRTGIMFLEQIPMKLVDIDLGDSALGMCQQGVIIYGVASKVMNGMEQRDAGIKVGGMGCSTIVIRNGKLMMPPDWNIDDKDPVLAARIRDVTKIGPSDVVVVGSAGNKISAVEAAINAAFGLI